MKNIKLIEIFVSCPSDCKGVRDRFVKSASDLNMELRASRTPIRLEVIHLDNAVYSAKASTGQEAIDQQIGEYDVYIGLMKTKFGTAVGKFGSGTEHEYNSAKALAVKGLCEIAFLFNSKANSKDMDGESLVALGESMKKVAAFKKSVHTDGILTFDCPTADDFDRQFRGIATRAINNARTAISPQNLAEETISSLLKNRN
jgi:hypothetical protein